jgi:1-acyl-sn-glycerol-3-phosphate acyltransferase
VYLPMLGVARISNLSGMEHVPKGRPFVCVSNHRGRLDSLLVSGLLKRTSVLIKAKHARFPMLAYLVRFCGYTSIDPSSSSSVSTAIQKCSAMIVSGFNLLVFPEGTRSSGARVRRFGKFAFEMATENKVPIVPVVLYSQTPFMVKSLASFYPHYTVDYHVAFLPPIQPEPNDTPEAISDRAYKLMSRHLAATVREFPEDERTQ